MEGSCEANGVDMEDSEEVHGMAFDKDGNVVGNYVDAMVPSFAFAEGLRRKTREHDQKNYH